MLQVSDWPNGGMLACGSLSEKFPKYIGLSLVVPLGKAMKPLPGEPLLEEVYAWRWALRSSPFCFMGVDEICFNYSLTDIPFLPYRMHLL